MTSTTEPVTRTFGHVTITTWTDHQGISINVFAGGTRNSLLSATYLHEDRAAAEAWYVHIRDAAKAGTPLWQIEAQMSALIDAARATEDTELAADVNATMDEVAEQHAADRRTLAADVAEIMRPTRYVRPTRTHVFAQPLNEPQIRAIRGHRGGIVHLGDGVTRPMLIAIADKGYGHLVMAPGTRYTVRQLVLNERGMAVANGEEGAA